MATGITYEQNQGPNNTQYWGSGYPTSTTDGTQYQRGDIIWNLYPTASGTAAWVCTSSATSSTPGGWSAVSLGAAL